MEIDPGTVYSDTRWLKRLLVILLFSGLAGLLAVFISHRLTSEDAVETLGYIAENTGWALNNIRHTATRDGKLEWRLDAESAQYSDIEKAAVLENPSVTFFRSQGKTVALTGQQGILDTDAKDIKVSDHVTMAFAPYVLEADVLHYRHGSRQISTESPVKISGGGIAIQADTMVIYLDSEKVLLDGNVKGMIGDSR